MNIALKACRRAAGTLVVLFAVAMQCAAMAQVTPDPYSSTNSYANPGSSGLNTYSGYGQTGAAPYGGVNGQTAYGAQGQSGAPGQGIGGALTNSPLATDGSYQPSTLPDYSVTQPLTGATTLQDLQRQGATGANPGAVYIRPSETPGQFQLVQKPAPPLSEFEQFVADTMGKPLERFGSQLILQRTQGFAAPSTAAVPVDYRLQPGDELLVSVSGSVEARLRLTLDNEGRLFVPKVGSINLADVRYGDLQDTLARRFNEQFKQAHVSVVVSRLHGLTVYVTGYAVSPGAFVVSSLATAADAALVAGGPNAGGSMRNITVRRSGRIVSRIDLYDLLLSGDKSKDVTLQNGDVINIEPVGAEVAVVGSVNQAAIYEAKPGETFADMVRFAGGPNSLADDTRLIVRRLSDLDTGGTRQISLADARGLAAERASIVSVLSLGHVARPLERQDVLVTLEGEVDRPGRYFMAPGSTVGQLLAKAGGLTRDAFPYGVELDRESVKQQQKVSYERALDDLELSSLNSTINAGAGQVRAQAAQAIIQRLRRQTPSGRVVLNLPMSANTLIPDLTVENNDRIFVPPRPKTVGVFGAVFQTGAFLFTPSSRLSDYLRQSGGPQRIADRGEIFVVRANGSVLSTRQVHGLMRQFAYPGDIVFVPVRTGPSFFDRLVSLASAVSSVGVTALTVKALGGL